MTSVKQGRAASWMATNWQIGRTRSSARATVSERSAPPSMTSRFRKAALS